MKLTTKRLKQLIKEELSKMLNEETLSERLSKDSFGEGKQPFTGIVGSDLRLKGLEKGDYVQIIPVMEDGEYRGTYKKFNRSDILKLAPDASPTLPAVKRVKGAGFSFTDPGEFFYTSNGQTRQLEKVRSISMSEMEGLLTLEDMMKIGVPMDSELMKLAKQKELPMSENRKRRIKRK